MSQLGVSNITPYIEYLTDRIFINSLKMFFSIMLYVTLKFGKTNFIGTHFS